MTQKELATQIGVSEQLISYIKKNLGITTKNLNEEQIKSITAMASNSAKMIEENRDFENLDFSMTPSVRRIDKNEGSSLIDMLQDCKEQYVKNEENIQRLQHEISMSDKLFRGNGNGTLQALPQLTMLEKFQKINISLRKQIYEFEAQLGRIAVNAEDDPFN